MREKSTLRKLLLRIGTVVEFSTVYLLGKCFGLNCVVRYLRNPNPLTSVWLLHAFGAHIGKGTRFKRAIHIDNSYEDINSTGDFSNIRIGENCYLGDGVYLDLANKIIIGENVVIAGEVALITHADCNRSPLLSTVFPRQCKSIEIKAGSWLGFRATVMPGVVVATNSVVAANALLRNDTSEGSIFAGIPASKIRDLEFTEAPHKFY